MYAMRKDRIMGDTRRRSRAVMSGADRRSSQRSGQPRRRPDAKKPDGRRQGQNAEAAIRPEKTTVRQHFCKWEAVCEWKTFTEGAFEKEGKERICILVSREKSSGDSDGSSDPADYSNRCSGCGKMGKNWRCCIKSG